MYKLTVNDPTQASSDVLSITEKIFAHKPQTWINYTLNNWLKGYQYSKVW
jgi:hypothetical protein